MSKFALLRAAAIAVVLAALPAAASDWSTSFTPDAVATHHPPKSTLVVVPAGTGAGEAAAALANALRTSGQMDLVMTGEALGDVSALDDASIVSRCAHLPVSQVVVVRVFPGAAGQPGAAVVTTYDKKGAVSTAYSTRQGVALEAKAAQPSAGEGVAPKAAQAVAEVTRTAEASGEDYDKKFIGYDDFVAFNQNGARVGSFTRFYQGKYKRELDWAEFYTLVGRKDLAEQYSANLTTKMAFVIGGGVLAAGAPLTAVALTASVKDPEYPSYRPPSILDCNFSNSAEYEACKTKVDAEKATYDQQYAARKDAYDRDSAAAKAQRDTYLIASGVGGGIGVVAMLVGLVWQLQPATPEQARELADKYNQGLKSQGGSASRQSTPVRVSISGGVLPGGGAAVLHGQF